MTPVGDWEFGQSYAAIFVDVDGAGQLWEGLEEPELEVCFYRGERSDWAVLWSGLHPDAIQRWVAAAHRRCDGTSFFAPVLQTNSIGPPREHAQAIVVMSDRLTGEIREWASACRALALLLPAGDAALLLAPLAETTSLGRTLTEPPAATHTLSFQAASLGPLKARRMGPRLPYDPVGAHAREVLLGTRQALDDAIDAAESRMLPLARRSPPELPRVRKYGDELFGLAASRVKVNDEAALDSVDAVSRMAEPTVGALVELAQRLDDYRPSSKPLESRRRLGNHAAPLALRAVDAVAHACVSGFATNRAPSEILTMLGPSLLASQGIFSQNLPLPRSHVNTLRLEFPRHLALRAGAFPLIARALAGPVGATDRIVDLLRNNSGDATRFLGGGDTSADRAGIRLRTLVEDLVSTAVVGPAYPLAMARFSTGELGEGGGAESHQRRPGVRERLDLCLWLLHAEGIHLPLGRPTLSFDDCFALRQIIAEGVAQAFDRSEMDVAIALKDDLAMGKVVKASPVHILNALWHGVLTQSEYINEPAVMYSLASTPTAEPLLER